MQIGTRARYGMIAMMDLARSGSSPARAVDIARKNGISKGYLEGLLAALRRAGLVRAVRGPGGGWVLAGPPSRTKALDIYRVLEGGTELVPCALDRRLCPAGEGRCRARSLWVATGRALARELRRATLADLAGLSRRRTRRAAGSARPKAPARGRTRRVSKAAKARARPKVLKARRKALRKSA